MKLSVIIPAYKDEKHIKDTIESVYNYLKEKAIDHEILVVTDGPGDRTKEIVHSMLPIIPTLKHLDMPRNMGKGFGVREGMFKAIGEYRLFTDADNATTIDHVERMMPYFDQGYDVVIGSIAVQGHTVQEGSEPLWRRLFGKLGNLYIQILAVPGIKDTQRGFKIFSSKAAMDIFSRSVVNRWEFDVEVLALARKLGYKIREVPVNWKNDPNSDSRPRMSSYFKFLLGVLKIRLNLMLGKYNKTFVDKRVMAEEKDQHIT